MWVDVLCVTVSTGRAVSNAVLCSSHSDQPGIRRRTQQPGVYTQGRRQHTGGDHLLPNCTETETGFPRRLVQPGTLPTGTPSTLFVFVQYLLYCGIRLGVKCVGIGGLGKYICNCMQSSNFSPGWPSGWDAGLAINRSRVQIPASPLSSATLGKLLTHMCLCHQAV